MVFKLMWEVVGRVEEVLALLVEVLREYSFRSPEEFGEPEAH